MRSQGHKTNLAERKYTMVKDNILGLGNTVESVVQDSLSEFIRQSSQKMLRVAIEEEVAAFIEEYKGLSISNGHGQVVRNGYLPERSISTGVGEIKVTMPRVRDRSKNPEKIQFTSNLIPKYMRRTATLDTMLPLLYLKGLSVNSFQSALAPMLGENAKNISPGVISRLKSVWLEEYNDWRKRDLSDKHYVYMWADGVYLSCRTETDKTCMLVIIGAD